MIISANHKSKLSVFEKNLIRILLEEDRIIAFPTDTVYGLGVNAFSHKAVQNLFDLKKRSDEKPLILLIDTPEKANDFVADQSLLQNPLLQKHWPGSLTGVFQTKPELAIFYSKKPINSLGIRVPDHTLLLDLLAFLPFPLVTTSANMSEEKPLDSALKIENTFNKAGKEDLVACIIDQGTISGTASTVVQFTASSTVLLRQGSVEITDATIF